MADRCELKEFLQQEVTSFREELKKVALRIWENPESAWKEEFAAKELCAFLTAHGVDTAPGLYEYPTAFRGETSGEKSGKTFAFAAEYDALPPGHACGHNLIGTASAGAMCAASAAMKKFGIPGKLLILGTPAEESGSGKVHLMHRGVLEGVDAVMMSHPHWCTMRDTGSLAIRRYDVIYHGVSSHAAGCPELGINALDAVMLLFSAVNAFRQQMPDLCRIHGIVKEGGEMPNIIPGKASCRFYLRSGSEVWMEKLEANCPDMKIFDTSKGVELMRSEGHWHGDHFHEGGVEPHIWNSTRNASIIAENICQALCQLDPTHQEDYRKRLSILKQTIAQTHTNVLTFLENADSTFLIYHPALTYFARDYGLKQISIEENGKEPSPAKLKELIENSRKADARIIFIQQEFDQRNAQLIARELNLNIVPINPLSYDWDKEMIHVAKALKKE